MTSLREGVKRSGYFIVRLTVGEGGGPPKGDKRRSGGGTPFQTEATSFFELMNHKDFQNFLSDYLNKVT